MKIKFIYLIYAVGGIYCIVSTITALSWFIQKKYKVSNSVVSRNSVGISIIVLFIAIGLEYMTLTTKIPDGEYKINVSVQVDGEDIPYYLPGVLIISTSEDYEEGYAHFGPAEVETTKVMRNRDFYLYKIYFGRRSEENAVRIEESVYPETACEVDLDTTNLVVNVGTISPQTLGITPFNNWEISHPLHKAEFITVIVSCLFLVLQYFLFDKERVDKTTLRSKQTNDAEDDSACEKEPIRKRKVPKAAVITVLLCLAVAGSSYFIYLGQVRSLQSQADSSYDSGYNAGYEKGYMEGHVEGNKIGYSDGLREATPAQSGFADYTKGLKQGYLEGYMDGYEQCAIDLNDADVTWNGQQSNGLYHEYEYGNQETVYITDTGSKYHQYGCQYLTDSCYEITLQEAVNEGYTPCSKCW